MIHTIPRRAWSRKQSAVLLNHRSGCHRSEAKARAGDERTEFLRWFNEIAKEIRSRAVKSSSTTRVECLGSRGSRSPGKVRDVKRRATDERWECFLWSLSYSWTCSALPEFVHHSQLRLTGIILSRYCSKQSSQLWCMIQYQCQTFILNISRVNLCIYSCKVADWNQRVLASHFWCDTIDWYLYPSHLLFLCSWKVETEYQLQYSNSVSLVAIKANHGKTDDIANSTTSNQTPFFWLCLYPLVVFHSYHLQFDSPLTTGNVSADTSGNDSSLFKVFCSCFLAASWVEPNSSCVVYGIW